MCKCCKAINKWKSMQQDNKSKLLAKFAIYSYREGTKRIKENQYFHYVSKAYNLSYCPMCGRRLGE